MAHGAMSLQNIWTCRRGLLHCWPAWQRPDHCLAGREGQALGGIVATTGFTGADFSTHQTSDTMTRQFSSAMRLNSGLPESGPGNEHIQASNGVAGVHVRRQVGANLGVAHPGKLQHLVSKSKTVIGRAEPGTADLSRKASNPDCPPVIPAMPIRTLAGSFGRSVRMQDAFPGHSPYNEAPVAKPMHSPSVQKVKTKIDRSPDSKDAHPAGGDAGQRLGQASSHGCPEHAASLQPKSKPLATGPLPTTSAANPSSGCPSASLQVDDDVVAPPPGIPTHISANQAAGAGGQRPPVISPILLPPFAAGSPAWTRDRRVLEAASVPGLAAPGPDGQHATPFLAGSTSFCFGSSGMNWPTCRLLGVHTENVQSAVYERKSPLLCQSHGQGSACLALSTVEARTVRSVHLYSPVGMLIESNQAMKVG